jgi:ABC-type multidrug transport system fused ATPase/permease subunit
MVVSKSSANMQLINYIPKLTFESALIIGACLVGIQQVVFGTVQTAISTLVIFITAGSRILPSLLRIQSATSAIQGVSGSSKLALNLLKKLDSEEINLSKSVFNDNQVAYNFDPTLELKNVNFSYGDTSEFSIKDLSLKVSAGSSLAIVGRSGSGKSTLVDLMLGVLNPDSGSVLINDGPPILSIEKKPGCIGYVPQTVAFVNGDVKENVAIGVEISDIDEDLVWNCLELAQIDKLFRDSLKGLDTPIGERGIRLSGGQRQRLGIARALYSEPQILILDEATSALDAETEVKISETLDLLSDKITLVVIAHRISTIKKLEKVVYLDGGVIRAIGSFDEVRSAVPDFERQTKLLGL